ncbi:MAG: LysR family transcriptional regulator [Kofleriaceae bacterium]|nr:LysR family transcriptional regulator [Kofleriaceae bacterium]MBP6837175.1 LysR family transcriptional regulator [Kofleriaceae bacterium]MBP9202513.1 LysR family transcriptional regulator [Kofleriaceae bacterium]
MLAELSHFALIAELGTFTAAAGRAHLSQPALTASVQRLEAWAGAALLTRGRRGAELTAAGAALLPRARAALAAVEDGRRAVAEVAGLRAGHVRIGAGATACTYFLPALLARFRRAHPGLHLSLREAFTDDLDQQVATGQLDLAIVTRTRTRLTGPADPWGSDELIAVGAPDQVGAGVSAAAAPWIAFADGSPTRAMLLRHVPATSIVMELASIAAVLGHARAGLGLALVSRAAAAADLARGALVVAPQRFTPLRRRLAVRHRGDDRLPPAAAALRVLLLAHAPQPGIPGRHG